MTQKVSFTDLVEDISKRCATFEGCLTTIPNLSAGQVTHLQQPFNATVTVAKQLSSHISELSPFDAPNLGPKITQLNTHCKKAVDKASAKANQLLDQEIAVKTNKMIAGACKDVEDEIVKLENLLKAPSPDLTQVAIQIERCDTSIDLFKKGNYNGKKIDTSIVSRTQNKKIEELDKRCLNVGRTCKKLKWQESLDGATVQTGPRTQFELFGGNAICAAAAYRGLVAMLKGGIENIDEILNDALKNYNALIYHLKLERIERIREEPALAGEIAEIQYGSYHLDVQSAKDVAPELESWNKYNTNTHQEFAIAEDQEETVAKNLLQTIIDSIPASKDRINRAIRFGSETYYLSVIKKEDHCVVHTYNIKNNPAEYLGEFNSNSPADDITNASAFLAKKFKDIAAKKVAIIHRDTIVQQFLRKGEEEKTYLTMLEGLRDIMQNEGKNHFGSMFICGREFYSLVVHSINNEISLDFFDSHGSSYQPLSKAYHIRFPSLEKAAKFLSLRKPCVPGSPIDNECSLSPRDLKNNIGDIIPYYKSNPIPENEDTSLIFAHGLKLLDELKPSSRPTQKQISAFKEWSERTFSSTLKNSSSSHFKRFSSRIYKAFIESPNNALDVELFKQLNLLITHITRMKDASTKELKGIKDQFVIDFKKLPAESRNALQKVWDQDVVQKGLTWNTYTPDHRIAATKEFLAEQLACQFWLKLSYGTQRELLQNYHIGHLKPELATQKIDEANNHCKILEAHLKNANSLEEIQDLQKQIKNLKENTRVLELMKYKINDALNEENSQKFDTLLASIDQLHLSFNDKILPIRLTDASERWNKLKQTLETISDTDFKNEEKKLYETISDLNNFDFGTQTIPRDLGATILELERLKKDITKNYNIKTIDLKLKQFNDEYSSIVGALKADYKSTAPIDTDQYLNKINALNKKFEDYCITPLIAQNFTEAHTQKKQTIIDSSDTARKDFDKLLLKQKKARKSKSFFSKRKQH